MRKDLVQSKKTDYIVNQMIVKPNEIFLRTVGGVQTGAGWCGRCAGGAMRETMLTGLLHLEGAALASWLYPAAHGRKLQQVRIQNVHAQPALRVKAAVSLTMAAMGCACLISCSRSSAEAEPSIEISRVPPIGEGSPDKLDPIAGRVKGARPGERVVLFALSGVWWVQPLATQPFTAIQKDSTWKGSTHPGGSYAALLVDGKYFPPATAVGLPEKGPHVLAISTVRGTKPSTTPKTIEFSGYRWEVREAANNPGGSTNLYDVGNSWIDDRGFLHLRISKKDDHWTSAEIWLTSSLGYGSYRFVVQDVSHFEPAAVFSMFTWDDIGPSQEMDIEVSRWGEPQDDNAQYVVQPYVVPANSIRFEAPAGTLTYWMNWQPGRASFRTVRGESARDQVAPVAEHVFTSGVPAPASEKVHLHLYVYDNKRNPLQRPTEVVIEKFEYLP
jgi:hypothetical protein